jgi:hypothetical protein
MNKKVKDEYLDQYLFQSVKYFYPSVPPQVGLDLLDAGPCSFCLKIFILQDVFVLSVL